MNWVALAESSEAKQLRRYRNARRAAGTDLLRERQRVVAFWRRCAESNSGYREPQCQAIYRNLVFWKLLMPGLRAMLHERARARKEAYAAERRREAEAYRIRKEAAKAAKRSTTLDMFA